MVRADQVRDAPGGRWAHRNLAHSASPNGERDTGSQSRAGGTRYNPVRLSQKWIRPTTARQTRLAFPGPFPSAMLGTCLFAAAAAIPSGIDTILLRIPSRFK